jgi:outer membrane protein assembly factor BamB
MLCKHPFLFAALAASISFGAMQSSLAEDAKWPSFLSRPTAEVKAEDLPLEWTPEKGVAWRVDLPGYGQSSPIVWGNQVFITSISGANKEKCLVSAFDLATGKKLWTKENETGMPEENTIYVSRAAASPVADAEGVVALFEGGIVVAYTHDGKERWKRNLVAEYGPTKGRHGLSSSIAQSDNAVYAWIEREKEPYILALNKKDGANLWKVEGLGKTAWSSPTILQVGDTQQLVLSAPTKLAGLDLQTGEPLWTLEGLFGNTTPSPRSLDGGRVLVGASASREQGGGGNPAQSNALVEVKLNAEGKWEAAFVWRSEKATCSFNSPLAHQDCAYHLNAQGVMYCLNLATGEQHYAERIGEAAWATPIAVDDRIYCFGKGGSFTVLKAGPNFEVLSEGRTWPEGEAESSPDKGSTNLPAGIGAGGGGGPRPPQAGNPQNPPPQNQERAQERGQARGGAGGPMGAGATQYAAVIVPGKILIRRGGAMYCITK